MSQRVVVAAAIAVLFVAVGAFVGALGLFLSAAAPRPAPAWATRSGDRPGKLIVVAFEGADAELVAAVAKGIEAEMRIRVEIADRTPEPTTKGKRDRSYRAEALRLQAAETMVHRASDRSIHGVLGITHRDLSTEGYDWIFGLGGPGAAVMSYDRFRDPDRAVLLERALKQGLSSAVKIVGIPPCETSDCARAFPRSLEEHDAKKATLCQDCQHALDMLPRR